MVFFLEALLEDFGFGKSGVYLLEVVKQGHLHGLRIVGIGMCLKKNVGGEVMEEVANGDFKLIGHVMLVCLLILEGWWSRTFFLFLQLVLYRVLL